MLWRDEVGEAQQHKPRRHRDYVFRKLATRNLAKQITQRCCKLLQVMRSVGAFDRRRDRFARVQMPRALSQISGTCHVGQSRDLLVLRLSLYFQHLRLVRGYVETGVGDSGENPKYPARWNMVRERE